MASSDGKINVALLVVPEVTTSALFGLLDIFSAAGRDWPFIMGGNPGEPRMRPYIVAREKADVPGANGIIVRPDYDLATCPPPDIVCIPDFYVVPGESVAGRYEPEATWLKERHANGALLASACIGAVLLGEAGFLAGCDVTVHWAYAKTLTNNYPGVKVKTGQSLVLTGEAQRIATAGGGTSWQDLALYLIARFVGHREAMEVAKIFILNWHDTGQRPFATAAGFHQTTDAVVARCQTWAADNYRTAAPVAAMVQLSGLAERTFIRRFRQATGMTPLDYIQALRLEEAKQMLETSDLPVEAIANEVGYEETSFFGRLFRREVGLTPAQYRLRFGALNRALSTRQMQLAAPRQSPRSRQRTAVTVQSASSR
jgi:transcriptional regulator GlxA family with amidase domain